MPRLLAVFKIVAIVYMKTFLCKEPICQMAEYYGFPCKHFKKVNNDDSAEFSSIFLDTGFAEDVVLNADIKLDTSGFHGKLNYNLKIRSLNDKKNNSSNNMDVVIIQLLNSDVYVDPFEIRRMDLKGVRILGDVDVEAPAWKANYSVLTLEQYGIDCASAICAFEITIPVHARYQLASRDKFKQFQISRISSMIKFENFQIWKQLQIQHVNQGNSLEWIVPVGQTQHKYVVVMLTNVMLVCGAVSIVIATVVSKYKLSRQTKRD
eukprot:TRINITY_DN3530_c0_g1_i4.p2 TRINITY_DN3530_c0_g1~~TRINITY_DN3530_c0_g1_i4.p2  ORF type:complete len:264 (-),score=23.88 TRINITY_DN3530_c0_g1_i4:57-848(-)